MNNQEILEKALDKAHSNGYDFGYEFWKTAKDMLEDYDCKHEFAFIFSHDFARTFWPNNNFGFIQTTDTGEIDSWLEADSAGTVCEWMFHLSKMVLEEDPIKYLEKFI